jgi:hypothetical protein
MRYAAVLILVTHVTSAYLTAQRSMAYGEPSINSMAPHATTDCHSICCEHGHSTNRAINHTVLQTCWVRACIRTLYPSKLQNLLIIPRSCARSSFASKT